MDIERRTRAFEAVDRLTELPMLILSVLFIPIIIVPLTIDLSAEVEFTFFTVDSIMWSLFALEIVVKTYLAPARIDYLRRNWFDVVIVAVPFARPLRVMRSARLLRVVRVVRLTAFAVRAAESSREVLKERGLQYALATGAILFVAAAGAVTLFERSSGGNINSFGDGIWWAAATVTTVGYGDRFPVTAEGRGIAVFLMLLGISLFSFATANLSAFFVRPPAEEPVDSPTLSDVMEQLRRLEAQIGELRLSISTGD